MIHWLTINKIIPATPSNRFIPHVKRTVFCRRLWCESASALGLFGDLHRHHRRAHEERLLWGDGERPLVSHRIHGAAIYGNIYHQYTPVMLAYIYISTPWILWVWRTFPHFMCPWCVPEKRHGKENILFLFGSPLPSSKTILTQWYIMILKDVPRAEEVISNWWNSPV